MNETFFDPQLRDPGKFSADEQEATYSDSKVVLTDIAVHAELPRRELHRDKITCRAELSEATEERLTRRGVLVKHTEFYRIEIDLLRMWLRRECGKEF